MMSESHFIFIIGSLFVLVNSDIFKLDPDYFADKPKCQELNKTLYNKIYSILEAHNGKFKLQFPIFINFHFRNDWRRATSPEI